VRKIPAGTAAELENAISAPEAKALRSLFAQGRWHE